MWVKRMYIKVKRFFDLIFSLIGLLILFPIFLIIMLLIKIDSKGPVFFKQDRLGYRGKVFKIIKFRTMIVNAEKVGTGVYSFKDDPRITRVGKFLRKTSLDEIPQLINILKGQMSFIGPRPTLTYHPWPLEEYTEEQFKRFNVRPGITGLAQIKGRKSIDWNKRIEYDVRYVDSLSLFLDIKLFFMTIYSVLFMKDNYNISETSNNNKGR